MTYYVGKCKKEISSRIYVSSIRTTSECYFINEDKDLCRQLIDPWGNLRNFPGIIGYTHIEPTVHELVEFKEKENGFLVIWTIIPDYFDPGDEWGFGREEYEGLKLYSFIDNNGDYMYPFCDFKMLNILMNK